MSKREYYLSELNISDRHGGGLTLQRILGDDLGGFNNFLQIRDFSKGFPTNGNYTIKEINLWEQLPVFSGRRMPRRFTWDYFINQYKRIAGIPNPKYLDYDYYNLEYSEILTRKIFLYDSKILIVPQHFQSVLLTNMLSSRQEMNYAVWMMDDHVLRYSRDKGFHYRYPPYYSRHFKTFLRKAKTVFVISENMRQFYKERFGIDSLVLFGPSDPVPAKIPARIHQGPIRLCYFGAVWKWQEDALQKLVAIIERLNAALDIYTYHEVNSDVRNNPSITVKEPVSPDKVKNLMASYDGVAILYGFSDEVRALSELNISTKLSECLASGIPTVLVGPEYGAMTRFARQHKCCVVLSDLNDRGQIESFRNAFTPAYREMLLEKARWVSENITSTEAMREVWREGWSRLD
jgi:hypothetical protein